MSGLLGGVKDKFFEADEATSTRNQTDLFFEEQQARLTRLEELETTVTDVKTKVEEFLAKTLAERGTGSDHNELMASYV
jgi:hypothetical protein